jgi:hypothetical protein
MAEADRGPEIRCDGVSRTFGEGARAVQAVAPLSLVFSRGA